MYIYIYIYTLSLNPETQYIHIYIYVYPINPFKGYPPILRNHPIGPMLNGTPQGSFGDQLEDVDRRSCAEL